MQEIVYGIVLTVAAGVGLMLLLGLCMVILNLLNPFRSGH